MNRQFQKAQCACCKEIDFLETCERCGGEFCPLCLRFFELSDGLQPHMCSPCCERPIFNSEFLEDGLKFCVGQMAVTPGASEALRKAGQDSLEFFRRHARGDWGDICERDRIENEFGLKNSLRLFSSYKTKLGKELWVITEWNRSTTTILLPKEY